MLLTTERLLPFIGGQIEIQETCNYHGLFRGEIEEATAEGFDLKVKLVWLAKKGGKPPVSLDWTVFPKNELKLFVLDMDWYEEDGLIKIVTNTNTCTLYPKGHPDLLDRSRVKGLK